MKLLSIGEVSKITGSTIRALRYYDEKGYLKPEYIDPETNYRYYSGEQLGRITILQMCTEFEIPLKKLELFEDTSSNFNLFSMISEGEELLQKKLKELKILEARMTHLKQNMNNLQEKKMIKGSYQQNYPERAVIVIEYDYVDPYSHSFSKMITDLYNKIRKNNLVALYNHGAIKIKKETSEKMFGYMEVQNQEFTDKQKNQLMMLPAKEYHCELYEFEEFRSNFESIWNQPLSRGELIVCSDIFDSSFSKAVPYIEIQKTKLKYVIK